MSLIKRIVRNTLLFWGVVALVACQSLGVLPADTFDKKVAAAYATVSTVAESTLILYRAGKVSKDEADAVAKQLRTTLEGIQAADTLARHDIGAAQTRLGAMISVLTALQAMIATKQGAAK